eukprot:gene11070-3776_t
MNSIIAKDLPRLKEKISIENVKKAEKITDSTCQFLFNLSYFLNTKSMEDAEDFERIYKDVKPEYESLFQFLLTHYGKTSKELLVLNCITQKTLAHPTLYFKELFQMIGISYLDQAWNIEIQKQEKNIVTVCHKRTERIYVKKSNKKIDFCHFRWQMKIYMKEQNDNLTIFKVEFKFIGIENFDKKIESKFTEEKLIKILKAGFATLETDINL